MAGQNNWPYIINLGNSIIGVAILAMPFCFRQCGIILAMLVLLFCTWLTLASCQLLMKAGIVSRRRSYEFLAYFTHGATGKFLSEVGMIGMQVGTLIAQIVVIGDLGPAIISKLFGIENTSNLRTCLIILLCLCIGLPLGLLKDLRAVSRASTVCISFYSVFVLYVIFLSLPNLWAGSWYPHVHFWRPEGLFQCLPILSFSFGCQTQLFLLYDALPEPSLKSISSVISSAVNLCAVAYLLVGFIGYVTFYAVEIPGDILAIFPNTLMADLMKLCFCFSIVITFPVIIFPCRASIYTLVFSKKTKLHDDSIEGEMYMSENLFKGITISIVLGSMITGILIPNVEFILGINGAIVGTLICYIFPALFFLKVMESKSDGKVVAKLVFVLGLTILLVSTFATLNSQNKGHSHIEPAKDVLEVDKLGVGKGVGVTQDALEKPLDESNQNLKRDLGANGNAMNVEKKDIDTIADDQRKEPPIPDPPESVEIETKRKKNGSLKDPKLKQDIDKENDAEKKQKELESAKKEKESQETDKKQEELLGKLEKHREEQEKLLKEQRELLKELKDHQEEDHKDEQEGKQAEKVAVDSVHKDIVDKQQKIINQQQKVIEQQQEQLNQQKNINIPPAQIPQANQQVQQNQQQELVNQQAQINLQQPLPKQQAQMNQQQPLPNQEVQVNQQQPLPNQQAQMNQQQPLPNQQAQMNHHQPFPNQEAQMNQQEPLPEQQAQMNQQQPLPNQQAQMNQQQPLLNQQAQMNPQQPLPNQQAQMKQQQPLPNQVGQINLQQPLLNQQVQMNQQQPLPNQQAILNQQPLHPNQQVQMNQQQPLPNQQAILNQQPLHPNQQVQINQQQPLPNQQAILNQQPPHPNQQVQMNQQPPLTNQQAELNQQQPLPNQQIQMNQQQPLLNQQAQVNQKLMENQQAQLNLMANQDEQLNQQQPLLNQQAQVKQ